MPYGISYLICIGSGAYQHQAITWINAYTVLFNNETPRYKFNKYVQHLRHQIALKSMPWNS